MGILYIVATPIGNLNDMTPRALEVLNSVDLIAAEDTRHSKPMLQHFGIKTACMAYHEHNEKQQTEHLLDVLKQDKDVALISDAGTPLISDPGYVLVHEARAQGVTVIPIPGVSALITALSASGLPTDSFYFAGFLATKAAARQKTLQELANLDTTLIFYETPRRLESVLETMQTVFGGDCACVVARELTKKFESFYGNTIAEVLHLWQQNLEAHKGECVIMLHAKQLENEGGMQQAMQILTILKQELPLKTAAKLCSEITGIKKNILYNMGLK